MLSSWSLTNLVHMLGLVVGLGAATTKVTLLVRCRAATELVPSYVAVVKPITRLIVAGLILLTLSGIGFAVQGAPWTPLLVAKHVLVVAVWLSGPLIDKVVEPRFLRLAPKAGEATSPELPRVMKQYLAVEVLVTLLFYAAAIAGELL